MMTVSISTGASLVRETTPRTSCVMKPCPLSLPPEWPVERMPRTRPGPRPPEGSSAADTAPQGNGDQSHPARPPPFPGVSAPARRDPSGPWGRWGRNDSMTETTDTSPGWLSRTEIEDARGRLPIVYVNAVPVRVDDSGTVTSVGLLLGVGPDGAISRSLVSGRVLYHERIRDALLRHLEKDLGPVALPRVPASPQPFTVAEYFPTPGITPFHDPRQHAVSLAYVVPVTGDCRPRQDALDLVWFSPEEAAGDSVQQEMGGGQGVLLRQALGHVGRLACGAAPRQRERAAPGRGAHTGRGPAAPLQQWYLSFPPDCTRRRCEDGAAGGTLTCEADRSTGDSAMGESHRSNRRRRARRLGLGALSAALLLIAVTAGAVLWRVETYDGNIDRISGALPEDRSSAEADPGENWLLVGSDLRGEAGVGNWRRGESDSDVIILLHMPEDAEQAWA